MSARKYRPKSFQEVVGQHHVTATLKNALAESKLAHALLFCGPRGVGKTTCARILAKALNCLLRSSEQEPCGECKNCKNFDVSSSVNVFELDAASNNSVEDIRNLVTQVRYTPPVGQFKVYIIDEVHMLSNAAFNAFLKTLEEPPRHVIFILATTERHKVLATIASRCQVFNFNRLSVDDITQQLQRVADDQKVLCERSALQLVAQISDGAMRDALSMYDLLQTFVGQGGNITYDVTRRYLYVLDYHIYFQLTEAFLRGDASAVFSIYDGVWQQGFDGYRFIIGLGDHLRNILVCKDDSIKGDLLQVTDNVRDLYVECAKRYALSFLLRSLELINRSDINYQYSQNKRLHVELLLLELANLGLATHTPDPSLGSSVAVSVPKKAVMQSSGGIGGQNETSNLDNRSDMYTGKEVDIQQVIALCSRYSRHLRSSNNISAALLLEKSSVKVQGSVTTIIVGSIMGSAVLQPIISDLEAYLKAQLGDDNITLQLIVEGSKSAKEVGKSSEQWDILEKNNPAIGLLKKRFFLEMQCSPSAT